MRAIHDKVILKEIKAEQNKFSTEDLAPRVLCATVISVGIGVKEVKVGDVVKVARASVEDMGSEQLCTRECSIFGIVED